MLKPFEAQTTLAAQYENFLGGGSATGQAVLVLNNGALTVPCTHTEIAGGIELMPGGFTPKTFVERCEVRVTACGNYVPQQYHKCQLIPKPGMTPVALQLWSVNTMAGGDIYRFALADANYKA
jgi:hypothetical protein